MASEKFEELMKLIMGSCLGQIDVVKQLLDNLDVLAENGRRITQLYSILPEVERLKTRQTVQAVCDAMNRQYLPEDDVKQEHIPESGEITVSNVHRNEQVNVVALSRGLQTILCSDLTHGTYSALWPMVGDSDQFVLCTEGDNYQRQIRRELGGKRLSLFPIEFVAKVYACTHLIKNTIEFWEDIKKAGLFNYWDPENGPYLFYKKAASNELQMLRVYKVDCDLTPYIRPNAGFRHAPLWKGSLVHCDGKPVVTDQEMEQQLDKFNEILRKHGNPPARRV